MNSDELKKLQAPLKDKYREHPEVATITLKASGKIGEGISCKVDTGKSNCGSRTASCHRR